MRYKRALILIAACCIESVVGAANQPTESAGKTKVVCIGTEAQQPMNTAAPAIPEDSPKPLPKPINHLPGRSKSQSNLSLKPVHPKAKPSLPPPSPAFSSPTTAPPPPTAVKVIETKQTILDPNHPEVPPEITKTVRVTGTDSTDTPNPADLERTKQALCSAQTTGTTVKATLHEVDKLLHKPPVPPALVPGSSPPSSSPEQSLSSATEPSSRPLDKSQGTAPASPTGQEESLSPVKRLIAKYEGQIEADKIERQRLNQLLRRRKA